MQKDQSWKTSRVEPRETPPVPAGSVSVHIDSYFRQQEAFRKGCFFHLWKSRIKIPRTSVAAGRLREKVPEDSSFRKRFFPVKINPDPKNHKTKQERKR